MKTFPRALFAILFCLAVASSLGGRPGNVDPGFISRIADDGGFVFATAVQPDGKILIGGSFRLNGLDERTNIARLNRNGSIDRTFNPGAGTDDTVYSIVVQPDGKILIGGEFVSVDNEPRNYIARLEPNGRVESTATFNPGTGPDEEVDCIALQPDGKILIGGRFEAVDGQDRNHIARLNADGTLESTATFDVGTGASARVMCIAVQADGKILLGGLFGGVNGAGRGRIARLLSNGNVEPTATFDTGMGVGGSVHTMAVQADGKILIGGAFNSVDLQPRNNIARLEPNGAVESVATFNAKIDSDAFETVVNSFALQTDGSILVGGIFTEVNDQPRNYFARLRADGTLEDMSAFNFGTGPNQPVFSIATQADGKVLLGGIFTTVNGKTRTQITRLFNNPAKQKISIRNSAEARWFRSGTAPEVEQVTFELAQRRRGPWTLLGPAVRIDGGWERTGLSLPDRGFIRARGWTNGGLQNGSSGIVEQITNLPRVRKAGANGK